MKKNGQYDVVIQYPTHHVFIHEVLGKELKKLRKNFGKKTLIEIESDNHITLVNLPHILFVDIIKKS